MMTMAMSFAVWLESEMAKAPSMGPERRRRESGWGYIRKITSCWTHWNCWKVLDSLDSLGLASNFCNNFSSAPDQFARSSTSTQFTDFINTWSFQAMSVHLSYSMDKGESPEVK